MPLATPGASDIIQYLEKKHHGAVEVLRGITAIESDDDYADAESTLVTIKQLYDKMSAKRKLITDPIKKAIEQIMVYENAINYTAKTDNEYNRVRKLLDDFNQARIEAKKKSEAEAKLVADRMKYRADYFGKVAEVLVSMVNGKVKNVIQQMSAWETKLTLDTLDEKMKGLRNSQPTLKREYYDECFRLWGSRPDLANPTLEKQWLDEFMKELPFEKYDTKFQEAVAPIKNEYLARIEDIRKNLKDLAEKDEKKRQELLKKQEEDRKRKADEDMAAANAKRDEELKQIADQKEINHYEADFSQQMMTSEVEAGPSKKVARFANDKAWLNPLLKVISKVGAHPDFKGIMAKDGYVPEVKKWLDFYSQHITEPIDGLVFDDKAKTIVRKK